MKKIILTALTVFTLTMVNAQDEGSTYKPKKGTVTTEVSLVGGLNNTNFDLNGQQLKFRYFFKDDISFRLGLGIDSNSFEDITGITPAIVTETDKVSNNSLRLGAEKHFAGSNRLSTYAGADLIIGFGKNSSEISFENGNFDNEKSKNSSFGLGLFTGADYYIAKKVYLGVEAGLSFIANKTKDTEFSDRIGGTTISTTDPGSKGSSFNTAVSGGVRIGYQF